MNHSFRLEITNQIIRIIDEEKKTLTNRELLDLLRDGKTPFDGKTDPHLFHEIAETALNFLIKTKYAKSLLVSNEPERCCQSTLKPLCGRLPTQTWRSGNQARLQQFSAPHPIGYLLSFLLNLQAGEKLLEPSAGTGSLAVWGSGLGLRVETNEIDPRRRKHLKFLGFSPTSYDGEFIDDHLPPDLEIDCLLMNPPFSSSGGRTDFNSSKFGFRHVSSALERLRPGGKFGIILGRAASLKTRTGNNFWEGLAGKIKIRAMIEIAGAEYYKNGTSVDTLLIIGRKRPKERRSDWSVERSRIPEIWVKTVEEGFRVVQKQNLKLKKTS